MSTKESNLNFAVVPHDFLEKIDSEIKELKNLLRVKSENERKSELIESARIPKLLGISRKTWQTYRDRRLIPFSQIGSKIFVRRSDLDFFITEHRIAKID